MDREKIRKRFMKKVWQDGQDRWIWIGATAGSNTYGSFWIGDKPYYAHRVAWWLFKDDHFPIRGGVGEPQIDHLDEAAQGWEACKLDVNPDHLAIVTNAENIRRAHHNFSGCSKGNRKPELGRRERDHTPEMRLKRRLYARKRYAKAKALIAEIRENFNATA